MGTLIAGIKEICSSSVDLPDNVITCAGDGTPTGHVTMAALGSRIMQTRKSLGVIGSVDDEKLSRKEYFAYAHVYAGASPNGVGEGVLLYDYCDGTTRGCFLQRFFEYQNLHYLIRTSNFADGTWNPWKQVY